MSIRILTGDCRDVLRTLPDCLRVNCCVTSPPYFGLRDYGVEGQVGLEETPDAYVAKLVEIFREVRNHLADNGTLWLNLGDSYAGSWGNYGGHNRGDGKQRAIVSGSRVPNGAWDERTKFLPPAAKGFPGIKPKDLIGIPWRVAFALQADGWYLRQDIIWHKPNPMPESVNDRCTKAHEYLFLLAKSSTYHYDADAIREPHEVNINGNGHNKRSVWTVATQPYSEAHFATFPPVLIVPCILAGCPDGGTVLDPFFGAGTTGLVADRLGRNCIGIELNPAYAELARKRLTDDAGMFAEVA